MNSIEMTDIDGDALTLLTHENRTWVTCTSGAEEVTVGPFPTHLVRRMLALAADSELTSTLVSISSPTRSGTAADDRAPEGAWEETSLLSQTTSLRTAMDGGVEAALSALDEVTPEDPELTAQFRQVADSFEDSGVLADHSALLGDREETAPTDLRTP